MHNKMDKAFSDQQKLLKRGGNGGGAANTGKKSKASGRGHKPSGRRSGGADGTTGADGSEGRLNKRRQYAVSFKFSDVPDKRPCLSLENVSFTYPATSSQEGDGSNGEPNCILTNVTLAVNCSTRACVVGPNGSGKSTLLHCMTGRLQPSGGEVKRDSSLRIGHFHQHFDTILPLHTRASAVDYLRSVEQERHAEKAPGSFQLQEETEATGKRVQKHRQLLGRFGLESSAHTIPLAELSGGQKARVVLASFVLLRPHVLVLDEPTNHLDLESINALIVAVEEFEGGVVPRNPPLSLLNPHYECIFDF